MHDTKQISLGKQITYQILLLFITFVVMFPILWVVGMSFNASNSARPKEIIPSSISIEAYQKVMVQPTANPVTFAQLAMNSLLLAAGVAFCSVLIGVGAAYVFSRFKFTGREILMMAVVTVLMLPSIATVAPLFVLLNSVKIELGDISFNLRNSLFGVGLAMISGTLPFAIWNLKGYLDTIPKDLEEAALIDGANFNQVFFMIILPLARPALAVTFFLGFLSGWTEFALSWQFLTQPKNFTLAMALWNMTGQYSGDTKWSSFAAMSILLSVPVAVVYLMLQRQIVGGLTVGGVK